MELKNFRAVIPLFILRTAIGWLFLHEGFYKLFTRGWTAQYFLAQSKGPLQGFFQIILQNEFFLTLTNKGVIFLLILIGIFLVLGIWERLAATMGMVLLLFFYLAYPPFGGPSSMLAEGNYLIIDKNIIILLSLWVISILRPGQWIGLNKIVFNNRSNS
ncbi:DoxX family protein [Thermophagus xiamenensis]|uniref:Thiosulfate dehydrogenase [quinone] large subunit n=1 Tax=Thermophagus xiamenensis TaxID=385682 RepID=A0A1I2DSM5_9BACT|nr:DoxX family protein [Thermophagus xiamenensis]SFE83632.1 thiosulfate dehydrogenase [quinone] large subunit [Thermophagus xiamenensis]